MPEPMTDLERMIEERAIERLIFDYSFHLDMNHPGELAALFVDDCEVSYAPNFGAVGREAYNKTLEGIGSFFSATSHHNSNIRIDFVNRTEAQVRSIVLAIHRYRKDRPDGWLFGQYHDIVVKDGTQWKFRRRELRTDFTKDYHVRAANLIGRAE